LPKNPLEVRLEEDIEELEVPPPLPPHRIPYTMHMTTELPNHGHLNDDSRTRKFLESKITHALENYDDLIRHVEVRYQVQEHFHREKPRAHKKAVRAKTPRSLAGESIETYEDLTVGGPRMPAPYQLRIIVTLKGHNRQVVYSNPQKHAHTTCTECVDAAVDGIVHMLREEKEKSIQKNRQSKNEEILNSDLAYVDQATLDLEAAELEEEEARLALDMQDALMEQVYEAVEAIEAVGEEPAEAVSEAVKPKPQEEKQQLGKGKGKGEVGDSTADVQDLLLR
jgi:hypothetical protein